MVWPPKLEKLRTKGKRLLTQEQGMLVIGAAAVAGVVVILSIYGPKGPPKDREVEMEWGNVVGDPAAGKDDGRGTGLRMIKRAQGSRVSVKGRSRYKPRKRTRRSKRNKGRWSSASDSVRSTRKSSSGAGQLKVLASAHGGGGSSGGKLSMSGSGPGRMKPPGATAAGASGDGKSAVAPGPGVKLGRAGRKTSSVNPARSGQRTANNPGTSAAAQSNYSSSPDSMGIPGGGTGGGGLGFAGAAFVAKSGGGKEPENPEGGQGGGTGGMFPPMMGGGGGGGDSGGGGGGGGGEKDPQKDPDGLQQFAEELGKLDGAGTGAGTGGENSSSGGRGPLKKPLDGGADGLCNTSGGTSANMECSAIACAYADLEPILEDFELAERDVVDLTGEILDEAEQDREKALDIQDRILKKSEDLKDVECKHTDCDGKTTDYCEKARKHIRNGRKEIGEVKRELQREERPLSRADSSDPDVMEKNGLEAVSIERSAAEKLIKHFNSYRFIDECVAGIPDTVETCDGEVPFTKGKEAKEKVLNLLKWAKQGQELAKGRIEEPWCRRHNCDVPYDQISALIADFRAQSGAYSVFGPDAPMVIGKHSEADGVLAEAEGYLSNPAGDESRNLIKGTAEFVRAGLVLDELKDMWERKINTVCAQ